MKPPPFRYARPATIEQALDALAVDGAVALAGGQSLIGELTQRRRRPSGLVDLGALEELRVVEHDARGALVLGAMVTLEAAANDPAVVALMPALADAVSFVGNPQVRARSTLGGSVAQRDAVGEVLTALVAHGASAIIRGVDGEREAIVGALALGPGELLVALRVPPGAGCGGAFREVAARHAARALAGAAALVMTDGAGLIARASVAVAGVAAAPTLLARVEGLTGCDPASDGARVAIAEAVEGLDAAADVRADERYRRDAAVALAVDALRDAAARAVANIDPTRSGSAPAPGRRTPAAPRAPLLDDRSVISLTVNGRAVSVAAEPRLLLSDLLRDELGLSAVHVGCEHGVCGACNVLLDGRAVRSCLMLAVQVEGGEVRTLEGLRDEPAIAAMCDAFAERHALQCGFCTPGLLVTLAEREGPPEALDLLGNLCRCTGYAPIVAAAQGRPAGPADARSIRRLGARRLARGHGRYVADLVGAGTLHAAFVRSPIAHARIVRVDLEPARRAAGVVAALAAADLDARGARELPVGWTVAGQRPGATPLLARERVRYVGEPVAAVIAESRCLAEDACELVALELEPLPVVVDVEQAIGADAPLLHPRWGDNVLARQTVEGGDVERAFRNADVVIGARFEIGRQTGVPIEARGATAAPDTRSGEIVVTSSTQSPHHAAEHLAQALGLEAQSLRVIAPDVGGSFGVKDHACVEEAVVGLAALALGRPVGWLQDRREHLIAGVHSRGQRYDVELAATRDGRILGVRGRLLYDAGARSGNHGAGTAVYSSLVLPGLYSFEHYRLELLAVVTNKPPAAAYRGYGAPEAAFVMEGLVDALAHELGLDPAEVRRRNLIPATRYPFRTASGLEYDSGDPPRALERALALARDPPPTAPGWRRGVGIATFVLMGGFGPTRAALAAGMTFGGYETARVLMNRDAHVTVAIGMPTQGQGIETALAQAAAAALGVDPASAVMLDSSDTARVPYSPVGAIASRGAAVGAAAVDAAARRLADQLRRMAGAMLGVPAEGVELRHGHAEAGACARVPLADVAAAIQRGELALADGETALEASATVDPIAETVSYGAQVAVVDVDPATGAVRVVHFAAVCDCGRLINPAIVHGQIEGGVVQGIGGALMEELVYADDGAPLTTTLFDYLIPTVADVPPLAIELLETPSPVTPTGARGAGELGIIGPGAAIANAVTDALGGLAPVRRLPLTPPYVRALARAASIGREATPPAPPST